MLSGTVQWRSASGRVVRLNSWLARVGRTSEIDGMRQHVSTQITVTTELLTTIRAVVRLDVSVGEEVSLEVGTLVETTSTGRTLVRRVVHMQNSMHRQRS